MTRSRLARLRLCALEARDNPSGGLLDTTFDGTGEKTLASTVLRRVYDTAVQPDGKIVSVGYARVGNPIHNVMQVVRTNPDGSTDTTFNGTGVATLSTYDGPCEFTAVALQPDGKIVVGGHANIVRNMGLGYVVARYNSNGTLDTTFGAPGKKGAMTGVWTYDPSAGAERLRDLELVTSGSTVTGIMLEGQGLANAGSAFAAMKLTPVGALDTSYGTGGSTLLTPGGLATQAKGMAVTPGGGVVLVGYTSQSAAIAVLTPGGQLDPSFNGTGYRLENVPGSSSSLFSDVAVQSSGADYRYVVSGNGDIGGFVAAYTSAGQPDATFATNGLYVAPTVGEFTNIALAADGSIFVGGTAPVTNPDNSTTGKAVVGHLSAAGAADTTFGTAGNGLSFFDTGYVSALAVDGAGRPVVGCAINDQGALARLTAP
jgi:uncharacterized delta-60 repeat protein